ncbi:hypothetical protein CC86DRAFT_283595 [Ophiobolus disseminans]|uniref:Uncharacterized protein n=1 Tax=Ophiobolus disseminans TaxID=1469910 RepID=A0A6A7AC92_9PLEO|nr:hypothetical protein CC86DRAFT_283595 [Ophiobolus disseminans]
MPHLHSRASTADFRKPRALSALSTLSTEIPRLWSQGWTAEICSCAFAVLSTISLAVMLWEHEGKALPEKQRSIAMNSIIAMFALLIRASIGVVLAEGTSQSKWQWYQRPRQLADMERFDAASRGALGSIMLLCRLPHKRLS